MKIKWWIPALIIGIVLLLGIYGGWNLHKTLRQCPVVKADTVVQVDTVVYHIKDTVKSYIQLPGEIIYKEIPQKVDTNLILKDWFALHPYQRSWEDTNIVVNLKDTITQNKFLHNDFSYQIKRPQTTIVNTIDQSITYYHYFTGGISCLLKDPKYYSLDLTYQGPKFYIGGQYYPELKGFGVRAGIPIIKFKTHKK